MAVLVLSRCRPGKVTVRGSELARFPDRHPAPSPPVGLRTTSASGPNKPPPKIINAGHHARGIPTGLPTCPNGVILDLESALNGITSATLPRRSLLQSRSDHCCVHASGVLLAARTQVAPHSGVHAPTEDLLRRLVSVGRQRLHLWSPLTPRTRLQHAGELSGEVARSVSMVATMGTRAPPHPNCDPLRLMT